MRILLVAAAVLLTPLHPAVVATSKPAQSLTAARVLATLPANQQNPWLAYLERSAQQLAVDKAALAEERKLHPDPHVIPKEGFSARSMPLDRDVAFYRSAPAVHTADSILSYQIANGAWSKNLDMSGPARLPGQAYTTNNISKYLGPEDFDAPADPSWNYVGTLDNDATNTELHFLLHMSAAFPGPAGERFRQSILRGIRYLLAAQFPNGGWPQVYPLEGGYHDAITFIDNAVTESASTLHDAAEGQGDYAFVPAELRREAAAASQRAIDIILKCQVVVAGKPTIWAQQHDPLTLAPVAGRNFEPAALSAGESSDVLLFLMQLDHPTPQVRTAITSGIAWLRANEIMGQSWAGGRNTPPGPGNPGGGRHLEEAPGAGPIWPRYTSLQTGKPVFGDRDKTVHDNVMELTLERRNGYAWYSAGPKQALDAYTEWKAKYLTTATP